MPEAARRLAAILSADVVGYSRLMADDEDATLRGVLELRTALAGRVAEHGGRVVDAPGDNLLAEIPSALEAVRCALAMQRELAERGRGVPPERRMELRIGVHLGDVRVHEGRLYGDGVNVAARLEGLAAAGGICVSASVREQVQRHLDVGFQDLGRRTLKNLPDPVHAFRLAVADAPRPARRPRRHLARLGLAAVAFLTMAGLAAWLWWPAVAVLLAGRLLPLESPLSPPLPGRPSLVVLPFANLSDSPEQEYFSDGITEDLTTDLATIPDLFVIARNSAFTYKGRAVDVEQVGRELGVRYVLEGSVRRAGDRVRINAQLIDATTGFHVWSDRYDRELADIFALQSEISERILVALQLEIREAELARIQRIPTGELGAYDAFQRGVAHFNRVSREDNLEARRLFEQAIELDPRFAQAYGGLAATYNAEYSLWWTLDPALVERGEELARRAIELDPGVPQGYQSLAMSLVFQERVAEAVPPARRAVELAPSGAIPHFVLGMTRLFRGDLLGARQSIQRAQRLNPHPPPQLRMVLAMVHLRAGRDQEAAAVFEEVRRVSPDLIVPRIALAVLYQRSGREQAARDMVREALAINPDLGAEAVSELTLTGNSPGFVEALRAAGLP